MSDSPPALLIDGVCKRFGSLAALDRVSFDVQPGEFFGEMSLLTGALRSATVLAATETVVYEIGAREINALLAHRPELAWRLAEIVAQRREVWAGASAPTKGESGEAEPTMIRQVLDGMRSFFSSLRDHFHPGDS